jgi:N-acetyl-beta-hexosaminidase
MHALSTLSQLIQFNFASGTHQVVGTPVHIVDKPRFPHRGLLIGLPLFF